MKQTVHITPVGHTKATLIEGIRQFPFHKIVLVLGKQAGPGEEKAAQVAEEIEKELGTLAEIEYLHIDVDDVYKSAIDLTEKIREEEARGHEVMVNASGSLRTVGISCYLASAVTGAELYVALPAYEKEGITGIRRVLTILPFPTKELGKEEEVILASLSTDGEAASVDELIERAWNKKREQPEIKRERARMSYHLKKLKAGGFIKTFKEGKNQRVSITDLGVLYQSAKS